MKPRSNENTSDIPEHSLLVDRRQICRMLNIGSVSLYRLQKHGLPFLKIGRIVRYRVASVLAWIEAQQTSTATSQHVCQCTPSTTKPQRRTGRCFPKKDKRIVAVVPK